MDRNIKVICIILDANYVEKFNLIPPTVILQVCSNLNSVGNEMVSHCIIAESDRHNYL